MLIKYLQGNKNPIDAIIACIFEYPFIQVLILSGGVLLEVFFEKYSINKSIASFFLCAFVILSIAYTFAWAIAIWRCTEKSPSVEKHIIRFIVLVAIIVFFCFAYMLSLA
jgi:hypothetical protein